MVTRRLSILGGLLAVALACAPAARTTPATAGHPYVVLVSFDAFRHDYIDRYQPSAFLAVAARGVRAAGLIPSFPSKTFPNHYTLATGLAPGHHGIVGNAFFDPARSAWYRLGDKTAVSDGSWYGGEPIWVTAQRNGVKTGTYFWPGSEAEIMGTRPNLYEVYDATVPNADRVNGVVSWLRTAPADRPHLVLLYFSEVDDTTHRHGPDAPQTAAAVVSVNRSLQQLLDSIAQLPFHDSVNVVLVSDHGMATVAPEHVIAVTDLLARAGVDTSRMEVSDNGPVMSLWFGADSARIRRARAVLGESMAHAHAYLRSETPSRWEVANNPRFGDVLLVADEGYVFERRGSDRAPTTGVHGYDPALPAMQGIFLAAGPGVKAAGMIPALENVDVYPFVAALLRLEHVPRVDGSLRPLREVLAP
ncbi:MAG: ectonucleotide pyrophosphatase/phosphodiesterase [bacterium]